MVNVMMNSTIMMKNDRENNAGRLSSFDMIFANTGGQKYHSKLKVCFECNPKLEIWRDKTGGSSIWNWKGVVWGRRRSCEIEKGPKIILLPLGKFCIFHDWIWFLLFRNDRHMFPFYTDLLFLAKNFPRFSLMKHPYKIHFILLYLASILVI